MTKFNRTIISLALALAFTVPTTASLAASGGHANASRPAAKLKVALAVLQPADDKGFNALAAQGLKTSEQKLGIKGTETVTNEGGDYVGALNTFVTQHYNFIVAVGALWDNAVYTVANAHPSLHFAMVDGAPVNDRNHTTKLKNVASLFYRSVQPGYIVGVLAGLMEKDKVGAATHNSIGMLGAIPLPFITDQMCGYMEGARSVDHNVKIASGFTMSFGDTQKGQEFGQAQIANNHADILFGAADASGLGYYQAAKAAGKYAIGFAKDQDNLGTQMISSSEVHVQTSVFRIIQEQVQGKFTAGNHIFGINNGGVGYATDHMHHVPSKIKAQVATLAKKLAAGKVSISAKCNLPS